jgi:catechol 2,3-dioxygenase-like lactoylglutathione lyase family enzyme
MIQGLAITTVWTFDQQRTKAFFTEKLGFEVRDDIAMGDMHWVTVGAKGQPGVELALMRETRHVPAEELAERYFADRTDDLCPSRGEELLVAMS